MLRKTLITLVGVLLLVGAWYGSKMMGNAKKSPNFKPNGNTTAVYVETVKNENVPVNISATGQLSAKNKTQVFSEVQGIMERGSKRFFEGNYFRKGEILLRVNREEFAANLRAQRAGLFNIIVGIMPDLRLDFPDSAPAWENYISNFDENQTLSALPEPGSEQEKFYVAGKQIYSNYYSIKNLEVKLAKYDIRAPFNGYISEALVKEGTLIRPGQKLGEFMSTSVFELEVPLNISYRDLIKIGKKVVTHDIEKTNSWSGKVTRINNQVDPQTQTFTVFIELKGEGLNDGMFLEADLDAKSIDNAYEISRKLLDGDNSVFIVQDSLLEKVYVEPVHFKQSSVIVRNIPDGSHLLSRAVPSAYPGMKVEVLEQ